MKRSYVPCSALGVLAASLFWLPRAQAQISTSEQVAEQYELDKRFRRCRSLQTCFSSASRARPWVKP